MYELLSHLVRDEKSLIELTMAHDDDRIVLCRRDNLYIRETL